MKWGLLVNNKQISRADSGVVKTSYFKLIFGYYSGAIELLESSLTSSIHYYNVKSVKQNTRVLMPDEKDVLLRPFMVFWYAIVLCIS